MFSMSLAPGEKPGAAQSGLLYYRRPDELKLSFVRFQGCASVISGGAFALCLLMPTLAVKHAAANTASAPAKDVVKMKTSSKVFSKPKRHWKYDRGTVLRKSRFSVLERTKARGCRGEWLRIAKLAWICSKDTKPTTELPGGRVLPRLKNGKLLPYRYVVTKDAPVYKTLDDAVAETNGEMLPGIGGYPYRGRKKRDGKRYVRISKGWIPSTNAKLVRAPKFKGVVLTPADRNKRLGFIRVSWASLYDRTGKKLKGTHLRRLHYVELLGPVTVRGRLLYPLKSKPQHLLLAKHVGLVDIQPKPAEVGDNERWIDINMAEQTLVAYQGKHPLLTTLVSTARTVTPKGTFRIERKRAFARMKSKPHYTNHWDVHTPWVISIKGRIAMHGVYWHNEFGTARSHGCVNLSPIDAKWVWDWTEPALPPGWSRIKSAKGAPGSVVRIRRQKRL